MVIRNNTISVRIDPGVRTEPAAWFARTLRDQSRRAGCRGTEVSLWVTGDARIRRLNRRYRGRDQATNCLSFPQETPAVLRRGRTPAVLGDIVVSAVTARREARAQDVPIRERLEFLMAHSLAHLLGYDHGSAAEARAMQRIEQKLIRRVT